MPGGTPSLAPLMAVRGSHVYNNPDIAATAVTVQAAASVLYGWWIDNRANEADVWVNIWDLAIANVTIGSTVPAFTWRAEAGKIASASCIEGLSLGTGCVAACTTAGGTGNTTSPTNKVHLRLHID